ncbi:uncharacterized protein [Coffea arabica]|uniref:Uncharacterized protein LOC113699142 isoform X1 n=1 Tax=Coffea arabica TaxID=13443 RepID=A0A6P6TBG7_COFAR|nr:uncharacterized protein LOC113699142 isoform X1 [Coffea arabica]XP_027075073.1 uncharacterized protein LOC113699142 isoform X1 [Coffea arabica]XP_027075074.1 uncharacterized protein LOC113699142 isoform X1 [Coffea arabica]XP_027075075.1 uncharacterized protein LOC113699142 isoform X1 [Coffea arabica]XP_027075076.1 uncharacterized protein LOC113699142 isoform X1 [Coffea arabica]
MKKSSGSIGNSGAYTSPGTPEYGDNYGRGIPKGWSSERVPLPTNSSRRHVSAAALMPFNSGRTLPSKWDDAERWITSPVSGYGVCKTSNVQPQRRPKSKSGPLGPPGLMYMPNYSPTAPVLEGGSGSTFMAGSPLTTGVLVPDGLSIHYATGNGVKSNSVFAERAIAHAATAPGLSDFLNECSIPSSQDHKLGYLEAERGVSRVISRRDVATQMSPEGSTYSSPKGNSSFSAFPLPIPAAVEQHNYNSAKVEIRDVQVDKGATITRQSKKLGARRMRRKSSDFKELASPWDISGAAKTLSKSRREEAKITAWENLQKAKAEAAIRKLEVRMKLEKKRSASMDKILNKLRAAQTKAQDMRNSNTDKHAHQSRISTKSFFRKYMKTSPLIECFFCCT